MEIKKKTILADEEYLRQRSIEVDFLKDNDYLEDIKKLGIFCSEYECLALAAIQIGIPKRIIYIKNTNLDNINDTSINEKQILINPVILSKKGLTKYWEACASCLDNMGLVSRPYSIDIEYYDIKGKKKKIAIEGFKATVLCHELDHLDGILHIDIANEILEKNKEERKIWREKHPYEIISKDCTYLEPSRIN